MRFMPQDTISNLKASAERAILAMVSPTKEPLANQPRLTKSSDKTEKFDSGEQSAEAYYGLLVEEAKATLAKGNYGISAMLIARSGEKEIVSLGHNEMFSTHDPAAHAEMNAIKRMTQGIQKKDKRSWLIRKNNKDNQELVLYTSLEPCPMCTENAINAGVNRIIIANEDKLAGAMHPDRFNNLPVLWPQIAKERGIIIKFTQSNNPSDKETYLPKDLQQQLVNVFEDSRPEIDARIGASGVLPVSEAFQLK